jgi:hypothetical protein
MKFNKKFKKYSKMFLEGVIAQEHLPIHQGDQVEFAKDWAKKLPDIANTSTGQRIKEMIDQTDNILIATSISGKKPMAYGSHGSQENNPAMETEYVVTVGEQYALGLYKNIVTVPMNALVGVNNGVNLPPLSKNQQEKERKQNYKGEEPKIDKTLSDPTSQTHASWKDHGGGLPS